MEAQKVRLFMRRLCVAYGRLGNLVVKIASKTVPKEFLAGAIWESNSRFRPDKKPCCVFWMDL